MNFIERCWNQETNHSNDDPLFLFLFVFLFFCFFLDEIVLGNLPDDTKNFASGLIVPGDLPDVWKKYEDFSKVVTL